MNSTEQFPTGVYEEYRSLTWYRILHYDAMSPFLVSVSNPGNVWMFVSTTGGITAGRVSSDSALFPYGTEDTVANGYGHTGSTTAFRVERDGKTHLWEPFRIEEPSHYSTERSFYKTVQGDGVMFSETNLSLDLEYRYGWEVSPGLGIHRFSVLHNTGTAPVSVLLLDGVRNVLPAGVTARMQSSYSNLLDAYKRSEIDASTGLGVFALSAAPSDVAEPSESLRATTIWSYGLDDGTILLSDTQIKQFRSGKTVSSEWDIKGQRGAYLRVTSVTLQPGEKREWGLCADVEQSHASVISLRERLLHEKEALVQTLHGDIRAGRERLAGILERNDGIQDVGHRESKYHHTANVLFNIMRGGYFVDGYTIRVDDFSRFVSTWNRSVSATWEQAFAELPETLQIEQLRDWCASKNDPVLKRLSFEYLPITFSRRHGDPSRPWNQFYIRTHDDGGHPLIGYQGNWRDIFQNWEALCISYPLYFPSVIAKFLNATTADGYNPYRISDGGIDWEVPDPEDPWANIGYWGDHQIVYLSRLMEQAEHVQPHGLAKLLDCEECVFAAVPYRIKPLPMLLEDPRASITFDEDRHQEILQRVEEAGSDGRLLPGRDGYPLRTTMMEKLLLLVLAKTGNYVPHGGIWLNTQRPEWNDANNALAGWGLSIVTVSYLLPFVRLISGIIRSADHDGFSLHLEVARWLQQTRMILRSATPDSCKTPKDRFSLLMSLGEAASAYRTVLYDQGLSDTTTVPTKEILEYLHLFEKHLTSTLETTRRADGTFESYQLLRLEGDSAHIVSLYPMLEGQVAGISSGLLDADEVITLLESLRSGPLYRDDQHTYMLYPNRDIPRFLEKNTVSDDAVQSLSVSTRPYEQWAAILERDITGMWHFNGTFRNARDLSRAASHLEETEQQELQDLFERTFHHASFTGRSGTFFAYEGLGSVYWHMVAKLLLAVQERLIEAVLDGKPADVVFTLKERYVDVRSGLGFNKTPGAYGAVPTDPYSHTPWGQGARQPGMTGQVKEEIIARFGELGMVVRNGKVTFLPELILDDQWNAETQTYAFTYCGVPFSVSQADRTGIVIVRDNGSPVQLNTLSIPAEYSTEIFRRSGSVVSIEVYLQ
jgi:hypothetical protein